MTEKLIKGGCWLKKLSYFLGQVSFGHPQSKVTTNTLEKRVFWGAHCRSFQDVRRARRGDQHSSTWGRVTEQGESRPRAHLAGIAYTKATSANGFSMEAARHAEGKGHTWMLRIRMVGAHGCGITPSIPRSPPTMDKLQDDPRSMDSGKTRKRWGHVSGCEVRKGSRKVVGRCRLGTGIVGKRCLINVLSVTMSSLLLYYDLLTAPLAQVFLKLLSSWSCYS